MLFFTLSTSAGFYGVGCSTGCASTLSHKVLSITSMSSD
jgi:hypothetical protein